MKTVIFTVLLILGAGHLLAQEENQAAVPMQLRFRSEIFFGPGEGMLTRAGMAYDGLYLFGQVLSMPNSYKYGGGFLYDCTINKTSIRVLAAYNEWVEPNNWYGYIGLFQDLGLDLPINLQPTVLMNTELDTSLGLWVPFKLGQHFTVGFWFYKSIFNRHGFYWGENLWEVDLFIDLWKKKRH